MLLHFWDKCTSRKLTKTYRNFKQICRNWKAVEILDDFKATQGTEWGKYCLETTV